MPVVQMFAAAKQAAGAGTVEVDVPAGAPIGVLREALLAACPALGPLLPHSRIAVNGAYLPDSALLPEKAEIALIPPVSGG